MNADNRDKKYSARGLELSFSARCLLERILVILAISASRNLRLTFSLQFNAVAYRSRTVIDFGS